MMTPKVCTATIELVSRAALARHADQKWTIQKWLSRMRVNVFQFLKESFTSASHRRRNESNDQNLAFIDNYLRAQLHASINIFAAAAWIQSKLQAPIPILSIWWILWDLSRWWWPKSQIPHSTKHWYHGMSIFNFFGMSSRTAVSCRTKATNIWCIGLRMQLVTLASWKTSIFKML